MDASPERQQSVIGFGVFEVDVRGRELRKQGRRLRLQEQPFRVLEMLLERAGELVTREELRQRLWPDSVYVDFDHGLNNAIVRLREVLGDNAAAPHFIETVPRRGYRFVYPLRPSAGIEPADSAAAPPAQSAAALRVSSRWGGGLGLALAAAIGGVILLGALLTAKLVDGGADGTRTASPRLGSPPSIAVLPFVNLSSDAGDEGFADGLTEELVSKLAGIRGLEVVARSSSFRFKGKRDSAAAIAQALRVDHLLEGSVRRSGTRLRVTAQLVDAREDRTVWSQTFDRDAGDIFKIQEDIAFAVAAGLKVSLLDAEQNRMRRRDTRDPEAHRLYLIGIAQLRASSPDFAVAKRSLEAAIARDPNLAAAHAGLARYHFKRAWMSSTASDSDQSFRLGVAAADRALALDPDSSDAMQARANFLFWRYRFADDYGAYLAAQADMQRAIELDPANAMAYEDFGRGILWQDPDLATYLFEQAMRFDALSTHPNAMIAMLGGSRGDLEPALGRCRDALARQPSFALCRMAIGTLDAYFGRFESALEHLRGAEEAFRIAARIELWSIHMSMGDRAGAERSLEWGGSPVERALSEAARFAMQGRYAQAFGVLERCREELPLTRHLDVPAAKFALIAGKPERALRILELGLPDLARGHEPISARNLLPAIDLATARLHTGARDEGRALLERVVAYLEGPAALRLPMFTFERARAHALAGENEAALRALDRAYGEGLRLTWALDIRPQAFNYLDPIDADPAFAALRDDPRLADWFERIRIDNARQLERLRAGEVAVVSD